MNLRQIAAELGSTPRHLRHIVGPVRPDRLAQKVQCLLKAVGAAPVAGIGVCGPLVGLRVWHGRGQTNPTHGLFVAIHREVAFSDPPTNHRAFAIPHGGSLHRGVSPRKRGPLMITLLASALQTGRTAGEA